MSTPLCLKLTNNDATTNILNQYTLRASDTKYGDLSARRFPHRWVSLESGSEGWRPGLHIICTAPSQHLPIVYANEGGNSLLLRVTAENTGLAHALTELEARIRAVLPV